MSPTIPPEDVSRLEQLLAQIAGRLDGALDFWTLVFLGDFQVDHRAFFTQRAGELRALVGQVGDVLSRGGASDGEPIHTHLRAAALACDKLERAFLVLDQFRVLPLEAVQLATSAVAEVYTDLRTAIFGIGHAAGVSVHYWEGTRAEQETYFQKILNGLYDHCLRGRGAGEGSVVAGHPEEIGP